MTKGSIEQLEKRLNYGKTTPQTVPTLRIRELGVLAYAYANAFTLWHYRGLDHTLADIDAIGYLDGAIAMMASGDHLHVSAADGGALYLVRHKDRQIVLLPMGRAVG